MPIFLIPWVVAGLGGLFVGSQIDNAVQGATSAPQIIDESKTPWFVNYLIIAGIVFAGYLIIRKAIK